MPDPEPKPPGETPPSPPPPAPPAPPPGDDESKKLDLTSKQLKDRLTEERDRAREAMLKKHGFEKADQLDAALAELTALKTEKLSEKEKLELQNKDLTDKAGRYEATHELLKTIVDEQFAKLPENVQKAIDDIAEGDPEQRVVLMRVVSAASTAPPAPPPGPPPPPGPKDLGPKPPPPGGGTETAYDKWRAMEKKSPLAGDLFYTANRRDIEASRPADSQQ